MWEGLHEGEEEAAIDGQVINMEDLRVVNGLHNRI